MGRNDMNPGWIVGIFMAILIAIPFFNSYSETKTYTVTVTDKI